jgi:hemerythrin superfamily protein
MGVCKSRPGATQGNLQQGKSVMATEDVFMARTETQDAIALLKADHRTVEALFEKFEKTKSATQKKKLAQEICQELIIHTMIEEEIFYPACKGEIEDDTLEEAYVEHDGAKMLISEIMQASPGDDFYDAKVKVLSEEIKHHVKEEEQRSEGMFAQARKAGVDVDALGDQMAARKQELKKQFARTGPPMPQTLTMRGDAPEQGSVEA